MRNIKHLLVVLSFALLFSSCLKSYGTEEKRDIVATFEYQNIKFTDSLFFATNKIGGFGFEDLAFCYKLNADETKLDGGFLLSCMKGRPATTAELPANPYRMYSAKLEKPNIYSVFKQNNNLSLMPKEHIFFINKNFGTCTPVGCYVANSEKVVEQIKATFTKGDSLTVVAKGYYKGQATTKSKINLAKFSSEKDSIVSTWTPFKLDKLGSVDRIDFEVLSTKEGIDKVFCMDNMVASIHLVY